MDIAIVNAEPFGNKGAEAMLTTLLTWLNREPKIQNVWVEITKSWSIEQLDAYRDNLSLENINIHWYLFLPKKVFRNVVRGHIDLNLKNFSPELVIDIGGLNFQDASYMGTLRTLFRYMPYIFHDVPLIFMTQDIGPSNKLITRWIAKAILNRSNLIISRSHGTNKVLEGLNIKYSIIDGPYPDITYLLNKKNFSCIYSHGERKPIVIVPSVVTYRKYREKYFSLLMNVIKESCQLGPILILVHSFDCEKNLKPSDLSVSEELSRRLANKGIYVHIYKENIWAENIKYLISSSSLVITSRYHALLAGLSTNVPGVAIGWNKKYEALLSLYNLDMLNLTIESDIDHIKYVIKYALDVEKSHLRKTNLNLKKKSQKAFEILNDAIDSL